MKPLIVACMLLAGAVAHAQGVAESHAIDLAWPAAGPVKPAERGQISGVALCDDGDVFVLGRGENHWMPQTGFKRRKIMQDAVRVFGPGAGHRLARGAAACSSCPTRSWSIPRVTCGWWMRRSTR